MSPRGPSQAAPSLPGTFFRPELHKDLAVLQLPFASSTAFPAPPGPGVHPGCLLPFPLPAPSREFGLNFRTRQSSASLRPGAGSGLRPPDAWPARVYKPSPEGGSHTASPPDSLVVASGRSSSPFSSLPQFSRTTPRTKYGECGFGAAARSSEGTAGAEDCPGDGTCNSPPTAASS